MVPVCPCRTIRDLLSLTSQSQIVLSKLLLARVRPSGLQATESTRSVCPEKVCRHTPVDRSHSLIVPSKLALARWVPSGAKASPVAQQVCPTSVCIWVSDSGISGSHTQISPLVWLLASNFPFGLQASMLTAPPGPASRRAVVLVLGSHK